MNEQKKNSEKNLFPSIEELYDLDLSTLLDLKSKIELGEIISPQDEDEMTDGLTKNEMLEFVNAEIKERNTMNEVIDFFMYTNIDFSTNDNIIEQKELVDIDKNSNETNFISTNTITKVTNNEEVEQNITQHKGGIKGLLNKTKIDSSDFQYIIGNSISQRNAWVPLANKTKKKSLAPIKPSNNTNIKINNKNVEKHIIISVPEVKKKKKRKRRKKREEQDSLYDNQINPLELRKNYVVPEVKKFIKKKEIQQLPKIKEKPKKLEETCIKNDLEVIPTYQIGIVSKTEEHKPINKTENVFQIESTRIEFAKGMRPLSNYDCKGFAPSLIESPAWRNYEPYNNKEFELVQCCSINVTCNNNEEEIFDQEKSIDQQELHRNREIKVETTDSSTQAGYREDNNTKNLVINSDDKLLASSNNNIKKTNNQINKTYNKHKNQIINIINNNSNIDYKSHEYDINENIIEEDEDQEENEQNEYEEEIEEGNHFKNIEIPCQINEMKESNNNLTNNTSDYKSHNNSFRKSNSSKINENLITSFQKTKLSSLTTKLSKNISNNSFQKSTPLIPGPNTKLRASNQIEIKTYNNNSLHQKSKIYHLPTVPKHTLCSSNSLSQLSKTQNIHTNANEKKPQSALKRKSPFLSTQLQLRQRAQSGKLNSIANRLILSGSIVIKDYSKIYTNFNEIFNGYYLASTYSQAKTFNFESTISSLYESFKQLHYYETNSQIVQEKQMLYTDIVKAEAGVIQNRLKKLSERLLNDEDCMTSPEKYYVLKKVLELEKKNYSERVHGEESINTKLFFRVVLSRPEIYDIVCYVLGVKEQWSELPHGLALGYCWNLLWTYAPPNIDFTKIFSFQKVNHLINNRTIHRKDMLKKHISRIKNMSKKLNNLFDIMPQTFILAKEYMSFIEEFHRIGKDNPLNLWIVKPIGKSRGKGIFVIDDISDVPLADTFLVQKYLTNPLLLEGYKFDLRIYVLVTSVNPLEMFLYKDGFARVSNEKFNLFTKNNKIHLTNAAIQNRTALKSSNFEKAYGGSKISLDILKYKLNKLYNIDFNKQIWPQVKSIALKALIACQYDIPYSPACFELFGFDIIIDDKLRCWLLEINSSPSLERSNALDDQVKLPLVDDILNIIDPINIDRDALIKVLERVMKIKNNSQNVYLYSPIVQLNMDLTQIFQGKVPRAYGEMPEKMGRFERLAPSPESDKLIKLSGGQKMFGGKRDKIPFKTIEK